MYEVRLTIDDLGKMPLGNPSDRWIGSFMDLPLWIYEVRLTIERRMTIHVSARQGNLRDTIDDRRFWEDAARKPV
jgi:hypothetical protein